jgi:hypothetical protein
MKTLKQKTNKEEAQKTKLQKGNYKYERNTNNRETQVGEWKVHRGDS